MAGHAILLGHGATLVTAKLLNVFHMRLTGSLSRRIEHGQMLRKLTPTDAAAFVKKEGRGREKYVKAHFHARLDNELLYDLVINTDRVSIGDAVAAIAEGAERFFSVL
ncbi:MAG TPA: cytidylate kinase family protein [Candidatus Saccharimonadales bacterium]|nr:cytidylate kinase family protein [Candidatus Saccharimonadales bacterium]